MHISIKCTIVILMSTFDAATSMQDRQTNACSVQQKYNGPIERHGPSALARVYRKYNIDLPRDVEAAVNNNNNNSNDNKKDSTVTPTSYDKEYLIPVTIGGQILNLQVDTGSSDLWVFSSRLSRAEQRGHKIYDPSLSNTSKTLAGETWTSIYGYGSQGASGDVCTDIVAVGTSVVRNQAVQLAAKLSSYFLNDTSSNGQSSHASCTFVLIYKLTECKGSLALALKVSILFDQINRTPFLTMSKVALLRQFSPQTLSIKLLVRST